MKKVVLIIPTYNEAEVIEKTIAQVFSACDDSLADRLHILIFDSQSTDGTADIIKRLQQQYPQLHLQQEAEKSGLGGAYMKAMDYAINTMKADVVIEYDADGSHQPRYIQPMCEAIDAGADVVLGSRYVKGGSIPDNWGFDRKCLSVVGNWISRLFLSPKIKDWTSGFRVTRTEILKKVPYRHLLSKSYAYKLHLMWLLYKAKAKVVEFPIEFIDRVLGNSKLPKDNAVESLKLVIWLRLLEVKLLIKVGMVGLVGLIVQTIGFNILRHFMLPQYANIIATEFAILSNFTFNNLYSFASHKLTAPTNKVRDLFKKGVQFNIVSLSSMLLQFVVMTIGYDIFGRGVILENLLMILGIGLGFILNYYLYSRIIWKIHK